MQKTSIFDINQDNATYDKKDRKRIKNYIHGYEKNTTTIYPVAADYNQKNLHQQQ